MLRGCEIELVVEIIVSAVSSVCGIVATSCVDRGEADAATLCMPGSVVVRRRSMLVFLRPALRDWISLTICDSPPSRGFFPDSGSG